MARKRLSIAVAVALAAVIVVVAGVVLLRQNRTRQAPCNILLITLDTTRADHVGCYGYAPALTPTLDALAAGGVLFEQAFANVPMTLPSHATVMTGLLPPEHGVRVNGEQRLDLPMPTLAELLRDRGYQTGAFIAAVVLDSINGLNRGFDVYSDKVPEEYKNRGFEPLSAYRPGDVVADEALTWLAKRDPAKPFFCWVHLFDPHMPYYAHEVLKGTQYEGQASYDGEIAFTDLQVGRLMRFLKDQGLGAETLIIAFGDHGEGLGEHGEGGHGHMLYETTLHVPLIFYQPGRIQSGLHVRSEVSLVDLFGTMQDLAGFEQPEDRSGRSLAPALMGQGIESIPCYSETQLPFTSFNWSPLWSLTTPEWKYIRSARRHLYDRAADAKEQENLAEGRRDQVERLEKELKEIEGQMVQRDAAKVELDAKMIAHLEALGYIGGGKQHFDGETMDYALLHDVEDMGWIIREIPRLRVLGHDGNTSEELIAALRKIVKASPESASFHSRLVHALVKADQVREALPEALECLKLEPSDHEMCQTVATSYAYLGDDLEAVRYYWKAIRLKPGFTPPHEELAKTLKRYGDADGAARHEKDQRSSLGEAAEAYELGIVLSGEGKQDQAIEQFKEALRLAPDDPLVHFGLALALEQKGDYAEAVKHCEESLRTTPDHPRKLYSLGLMLGKAGRNQEAAEHLAKLVQIEPENVSACTNLGLVLARQGKLDEALTHFTEALRLAPNDGQVHLTRAGVLEESRHVLESLVDYREAVRLNPERKDWADHLARLLATYPSDEVRDGAEAVRLAEGVCAGPAPRNATFLDTLAAAYAEAGRFEEAAATAREALSLALESGKADLAAEIQQRLELYQAGRPFRTAAKQL